VWHEDSSSSSAMFAQVDFCAGVSVMRRAVSRGICSYSSRAYKMFGVSGSLATWEDLEALHQRSPDAPA
jgi:hypothetical protein